MRGCGVASSSARIPSSVAFGDTFSLWEKGARRRARRLPTTRSISAACPQPFRTAIESRWGAPATDPFVGDGALRPARAPLRQRRDRHPAGARLQHRSEGDLPRPGSRPAALAISPSISGCARNSAPTRWSTWASTAISNGCRARRWRCRKNAFRRRRSGRCR